MTVAPELRRKVSELKLNVFAFGFNIPPLTIFITDDGEKVTLLARDIFPELFTIISALELIPVPDKEVVVSNAKNVGLIVSLFIRAAPRIVKVELAPSIIPLFVTVLFARTKYPPANTENVAPASTVIVPL